jgi:probable rRNA maturation factor
LGLEISVQVGSLDGSHRDPSPCVPLVRRAAEATLRRAGIGEAFLSVTLLADAPMADLNATQLGHAGPTDVISFRLDGPDGRLEGDVYIGHQEAARTAADEDLSWEEELVRLAVHGTLHVLGHDHAPGPERVLGEMWRLQEAVVSDVMRRSTPSASGGGQST